MSILLIRDAMSQLEEPELQAIADDAATILMLQGHHVDKTAVTMQARFSGGNEAVITWFRRGDGARSDTNMPKTGAPGLCSNCGQAIALHCTKHTVPCCPGRCS